MAKTGSYDPSNYAQQQEKIRKARGNPNKNIHHKKKNSNYGGSQQAPKPSERMQSRPRKRETIFTMTPGVRIAFIVLVAAMAVLMILGLSSLKGNSLVSYLSSLATGAACCLLGYTGHTNKKRGKPSTPFQNVLVVVLAGLGVVYLAVGIMSLVGLLQA